MIKNIFTKNFSSGQNNINIFNNYIKLIININNFLCLLTYIYFYNMKAAKQSLFGRDSQFILLWCMEIAHLPVVALP